MTIVTTDDQPGDGPPGYRFTDRVRRVLLAARAEAAALHHGYVGTEHILLGLIREESGIATAVLGDLQVDFEEVEDRVFATIKPGQPSGDIPLDQIPYTSRAKKVLELAMTEARELNHDRVGAEHLLLGLLREEKGIAAQTLTALGATWERAREETLRLLAEAYPPPDAKALAREIQAKVSELAHLCARATEAGCKVEYEVEGHTRQLKVRVYKQVEL